MRKVIKLNIYDCKVNFIVSNDVAKDITRISKKHKEDFSINYEVEGIVFYFDLSQYYLIINSSYLSHNTIAHEIYHLVIKVTETREITDEESQAWLCGVLTQEIYKYLHKNKLVIS
jgi:hypothetical protein